MVRYHGVKDACGCMLLIEINSLWGFFSRPPWWWPTEMRCLGQTLVWCSASTLMPSYTWSLFYCREDAYWDLKPWTRCQGERGVGGVVAVVGIIMYLGPRPFSHHQLRKKGEGKCGASSALLSGTWWPLLVHDLWRELAGGRVPTVTSGLCLILESDCREGLL